MVDLSDSCFLMIEPDKLNSPLENPMNDIYVKMVDFIFSKATRSNYRYRGFHVTKCGVCSDNDDWFLPNGMLTNSLCKYYIRYYYHCIPASEMDKIKKVYVELGGTDITF